MSDAEVPAATDAEIDSVPGLRVALEIIGHARGVADENGRCVIEFERTESGGVNIQDVTQHVEILEGVNALLLDDEEDADTE